MTDAKDPPALYKIFGHVAHKLHYSKVDTIGRNTTIVKLTSWESHFKCAGIGTTPIQITNPWWPPRRSIEDIGLHSYFDIVLFSASSPVTNM
jgi:hypothetical protein